jgi:hypothetical protein
MQNSTLLWVTDGSYNRKLAADLSGAGWIIICYMTGSRLTGSFWKRSTAANLYPTELLGLSALHILERAIEEYYQIKKWTAVMCCYNKEALEMSSYHLQGIKSSVKCADVQRNL